MYEARIRELEDALDYERSELERLRKQHRLDLEYYEEKLNRVRAVNNHEALVEACEAVCDASVNGLPGHRVAAFEQAAEKCAAALVLAKDGG